MSNYRPQLFLRTADITVALTFPDGTPDAAEKMVSIDYWLYLIQLKRFVGHAGR